LNLEFESENEGEIIECPGCGLETKLYIPQAPLNPGNPIAMPAATPITSPQASARQPQVKAAKILPVPAAPGKQKRWRRPPTYFQAVVAILLLFIGLLATPTARSLLGVHPQEWEYQVISFPDHSFNRKINEFGAQGWELVFARRASAGEFTDRFEYEMIFKRPKQH
jgi:hypothetical protein